MHHDNFIEESFQVACIGCAPGAVEGLDYHPGHHRLAVAGGGDVRIWTVQAVDASPCQSKFSLLEIPTRSVKTPLVKARTVRFIHDAEAIIVCFLENCQV